MNDIFFKITMIYFTLSVVQKWHRSRIDLKCIFVIKIPSVTLLGTPDSDLADSTSLPCAEVEVLAEIKEE